jgi:cyclohexanone monooxygenase
VTDPETATGADLELDVVVVGAGFAGLAMLHRVRTSGLRVRVLEAGGGVGGTWYWNRYPGARCDVASMEYSYSFDEDLQQEWHWSERYSTQPEILAYLEHVADRFDLRRDIELDTPVVAATYDDGASRWEVHTDRGETFRAQFVVMATGCLSAANVPDIPGLDSFGGQVLHTGRWPHEPIDLSGRRVALVGTGSSGVQSVPVIAREAAELFVFQRTASYSLPAAHNPLGAEEQARVKAEYADFRARNRRMIAGAGADYPVSLESVLAVDEETRGRAFERGWAEGGFNFVRTFSDLMLSHEANGLAADFLRDKIRSIVSDPEVAELLVPTLPIGCKRMCIDRGYYETFNFEHVHLVDLSEEPIHAITPAGVVVGDHEYAVDVIVFATGFDAMTGSLLRVDIRGRGGVTLRDVWHAGPLTYLGLGVAGFPNLFAISGPGSPSVLTNMVVSIEQHVEWIGECIDHVRSHHYRSIEATEDAQTAWAAHVNAVAEGTLFRDEGCNSWYLGANIPDKPRVFMPLIGFPAYADRCAEVAAAGYEGFQLSG